MALCDFMAVLLECHMALLGLKGSNMKYLVSKTMPNSLKNRHNNDEKNKW